MSDLARPGALPLRPLTTGELLDAAVALLRTRTGRLIGLGAALALAEQVVLFPLRRLADQNITLLPGTGALGAFGVLIMVGFATEAFCIAVLGGVAATAAPRAMLGTAAPRRPPARLPAVVTVAVIAGTVAGLAAWPFLPMLLSPLKALGIPIALFLTAVLWPVPYGLVGLAAPAAVLEGRGPGTALARSVRLASRDGLRVVWIRVLGYAAWLVIRYGLIAATTALVSIAVRSPSSTVDDIVLAASALVVNALSYPTLGCLDVALHLEARMRTEGLDILLRGALRRGIAPDTALAVPQRALVTPR